MLTIYSTKTCVWCKQVERLFNLKKVAYEKVYLDDNPKLTEELLQKTGAMTVPITTDGHTYVVGWNVGALMKLITSQI